MKESSSYSAFQEKRHNFIILWPLCDNIWLFRVHSARYISWVLCVIIKIVVIPSLNPNDNDSDFWLLSAVSNEEEIRHQIVPAVGRSGMLH